MRVRALAGITVALALTAGCSDGGGGGGEATKPCPPKGIGVAAFQGATKAQQVTNWKDYKCSQPQICPDVGAADVPLYIIDPKAAAHATSLVLTNCSTGNAKLTVSKVVMYGDAKCAFGEPQIDQKVVDPNGTAVIQATWKPKKAGEHHAAFWVYSNAQNFPVLKIPACGIARPKPADAGTASGDGGVPDSKPAAADAAGTLKCKAVTTINGSCHKDPP